MDRNNVTEKTNILSPSLMERITKTFSDASEVLGENYIEAVLTIVECAIIEENNKKEKK